MAGKSPTIRVSIVGDAQKLKTALGDAQGAVSGMESKLTKAGVGMVGAATVIATGLYKVGSAAGDQNAALSAMQQVLGDSSGAVEEWARDSVRAAGLSKRSAYEYATAFGGIAKAAGMAGDEVAQFAIDHNVMAADMAAFKNVSPEQAIADLQSAYAGSSETLRKYNIYVDDATLKAAYFRETGEQVSGTLTSQQRIIATHSEIVRQGADMWGQWDREAGEAAAQEAMLGAEMDNLKASIGQGVLPVMTDLVSGLSSVVGWFNSLDESTKAGIGRFGLFVTATLGVVGSLSFIGGQALKVRNNLTTVGTDGVRSLNKLGKAAGAAGAAGAFVALAAAIDGAINTKFRSASETMSEVAEATDDELIPAFAQAIKTTGELLSGTEAYEALAKESIGTAERLADAMDRQGMDSAQLREIIAKESEAQRQANADTERGAEIIEGKASPAVQGLTGDMEELGKEAEDVRTDVELLHSALTEAFTEDIGYRDALRATADRLDDLVLAEEAAKRATDDLTTPIDEAAAASRDYEAALDDATQAALRQAEQAVKTAEANAALEGRTLTSAERTQILNHELNAVAGTLAEGHPLRQRLQGYLGELRAVPANVHTQLTIDATQRVSRIVTETVGSLNPFGRRAAGGDVRAGGTYLVGEDGPELLEMGAGGGRVVPAGRTRDRLAGGDTYNITIGSVRSDDDIRKLEQMLRRLKRQGSPALRGIGG